MANGNWSDLRQRIASAAGMLVVGVGAVWLGGAALLALGCLIVGLMIWELARMIDPAQDMRARIAGAAGGAVFAVVATGLAGALWWVLVLVVPLGLYVLSSRLRIAAFLYALAVTLAMIQILSLRSDSGLALLLWLALVVIASDVMGYFAGRALGGPKFWPRISPKKTWSGTVAGWVGAGVVGYFFAGTIQTGAPLVVISVVTAFAAQMGDIAESAIKRRAGVKDSSGLIPGHGGLMDRFDGFVGAGVFLFVASLLGVAL